MAKQVHLVGPANAQTSLVSAFLVSRAGKNSPLNGDGGAFKVVVAAKRAGVGASTIVVLRTSRQVSRGWSTHLPLHALRLDDLRIPQTVAIVAVAVGLVLSAGSKSRVSTPVSWLSRSIRAAISSPFTYKAVVATTRVMHVDVSRAQNRRERKREHEHDNAPHLQVTTTWPNQIVAMKQKGGNTSETLLRGRKDYLPFPA
jgi:hypothetical protein